MPTAPAYLATVPANTKPTVSFQMAATSAAVYHELPCVLGSQQPQVTLWVQLPEPASPSSPSLASSSALGGSPMPSSPLLGSPALGSPALGPSPMLGSPVLSSPPMVGSPALGPASTPALGLSTPGSPVLGPSPALGPSPMLGSPALGPASTPALGLSVPGSPVLGPSPALSPSPALGLASMLGSPALGSPALRPPVEPPSPTQLPQPAALQGLAKPTPWQQQQSEAQQQQQPAPACDKVLTRGARRRIQQRLRKKMGKLERARAAASSTGQALLPQRELMPSANLSREVDEPASCANCSHEVEECPMLVVDKATQLPALGALPGVPNLTDKKIVPVCAIQSVPRLEDAPDIETMDAFVKLPLARGGAKADPTPQANADSNSQAQAAGSSLKSLPRRGTWPQTKMQIPTVNTFVHFHFGSGAEPKRRSRSV